MPQNGELQSRLLQPTRTDHLKNFLGCHPAVSHLQSLPPKFPGNKRTSEAMTERVPYHFFIIISQLL
jgi:hypothetical protein